MTPRSSCPGGDHSPPGRKPPAQLRINKVTEPAVGISRPPPLLAMASATARLGHFWKVPVGQFWRAPKFLRRNIQKKLDKIGLGWVNFQVLRRTQASLGHKEGIDPKVAADQRGHAIGVAIDTYTESDLESRREVVTKLEDALAGRKSAKRTAAAEESSELSFRGNEVKLNEARCAKL